MPRPACIAVAASLALAAGSAAQTLPDGFVLEQIVGEPFVAAPVAFAPLPDGRVLLVEQASGVVRLAAVGAGTSDSILTVPGVRAMHPERGLLGVAVDPDWPARPYVYFDYTHVDSVSKVTMYTASGSLDDPGSTALTLSSPYHLLDDIPDQAGIHNAGSLRFGPDGMLYVSVGDDNQCCMAQDLTSPLGKLLRLDVTGVPDAGGGPPPKSRITPPDNPFPGPDPWERLVYAWGLRNPFRFTVDAPTGRVFIGSVGSHLYEEINRIPGSEYAGNNYGWPQWEGDLPITACGTCGQGNTFTDAIHLIPHPVELISVVGGPVLRTNPASPSSFPASYEGDYFYFEFFGGTLHRLRETAGAWSFAPPAPGQPDSVTWGTGFHGACDAQVGPDGALWFLSLGYCCGFSRGLYRIAADAAMVGAPEVAPEADGVHVRPNPTRAGHGAVLGLPRGNGVRVVRLVDAAGRLVRTLRAGPGATVRWDGRSDAGHPVTPGVYLVRVEGVGGAAGSAKIVVLP
jgi:hypothetical protein